MRHERDKERIVREAVRNCSRELIEAALERLFRLC
jgi:hypothetical protein